MRAGRQADGDHALACLHARMHPTPATRLVCLCARDSACEAFNHIHVFARARTSSRSPSNAMSARRVSKVASASPPTVPCARSLHPRQGRDLACNCTQPGRVRPSAGGSPLGHGIAPPAAARERRTGGRAKSASRRMEPPGGIPALTCTPL